MRGFGGPQGTLLMETLMDRIAHELDMDPLEVRMANLTREGDWYHCGQTQVKGCTLARCVDEVKRKGGYDSKQAQVREFNARNRMVKKALALVPLKFACSLALKFLMKGVAAVRVYADGSVLVHHGGHEMGQGINTKMAQVNLLII